MFPLRRDVEGDLGDEVERIEIPHLALEMAILGCLPGQGVFVPIPSQLLEANRGANDVLGKGLPGGIVVDPRAGLDREAGVVPSKHGHGQVGVQKVLVHEEGDNPSAPEFQELFAGPNRNEVEPVELVEAAIQDEGMPVGMERGKFPKCLVAQDNSGGQGPTGGLGVVLRDQGEDEFAEFGEQRTVVFEENSQALRDSP